MSSNYVPPPKSQYEIERDERIARNEAFMRSLGLGGGLGAVVPQLRRPAAAPRPKRPRDWEPREGERKSSRLAGEPAPDLFDVRRDALAEADAEAPARRCAHFRVPRGSRLTEDASTSLNNVCGETRSLTEAELKAAKEARERLEGEWNRASDCRRVMAAIPNLRRPPWLASLERSPILSTKNATHTDKVMVVLERCAAGIGLTLPHWPDRARLCDHQCPLTLGSDTELLKYCGKRLEVVHGEDTSNGWAYTHALGKLKAYQALLVTEAAFSNVPLADLEQGELERLMPPLALDREAKTAESTKEATAEGAKVTTVATGEHATAAPPAEPAGFGAGAGAADAMDAEPTAPAAPVAAEPAPMAVEPASLLDAERRVLAEPEAAEAPPAPDAPAPAPAAARPALAVDTAPAAPAAAAAVVTPTDALARLAEMEAKAKERFAALDAEDEARRQKKREEQDAKAAARAEAAAARKAAKADAAEDAESDEEDAPGDASDEDFEAAPPPKPKKAPKEEDEEPVETEVVMRKMNPFIYFSQQKRAAVKAEVEASINEEATPQERNREVLARIGVLWKALSDADKQKWKDEAPEKETTVKKKKKKSAGGTPKGAKKEAKAAAATAEKMKAEEDEDGAPKLKKQSGYMYHNAQNREAAKAAVAAAEPDLSSKEANQAVMKKLAEMWGALDDAAKQKYKDDAPMVEVKAKKAPKEPKPPKEPKAPKAAKHLFQSKPDGKKQTSMMSFFAKKA